MSTAIGSYLLASMFILACSPAIAGNCSTPSIVLNGFDSNFKIQRDIRAEDITVKVGHKQVPVLSLSFDDHARRIVFMVDSSGSMEPPHKNGWGLTIPAAVFAASVIPESASSALVTFSEKLHRESNDFENRKRLEASILGLAKERPKGETALFDSIHRALIVFPELRFGDAIYIVTDGGDNKSKISLAKLEEETLSRGVRVFVFLVSRGGFRTVEESSGASQVASFAESTGGDVVQISSAEIAGGERAQLDKLAPRIVSQVEGVYRVELSISQAGKAGHVKVAFINRDRAKNSRNLAYSQIMLCPEGP